MLEANISGDFRRHIYQAASRSLNDLYTCLPIEMQSYVRYLHEILFVIIYDFGACLFRYLFQAQVAYITQETSLKFVISTLSLQKCLLCISRCVCKFSWQILLRQPAGLFVTRSALV